jgi:serine protein kinase
MSARGWPHRFRVVTQPGEPGLNPKVNQLVTLARHARHNILVVSDSNIRVQRDYLDRARFQAGPLRMAGVWGWKDPRNSLTMPFWHSVYGRLRTIVVVRNPLEVVTSLHRRNGFSPALALTLWRIYAKLLRQTNIQHLHIAPHALRLAAIFAILSRLEEPKTAGLTLLKKLKLYDGEDVEGFRQKDLRLIQEQTEREGMDGISPRFIINRISSSLIKPDARCINPIDILRAIRDGLENQGQFKKVDRERYQQLIAEARREYDEIARNDVQKAFFVSFDQEAAALVDNYMDNVEAYLDHTKLTDPITGEEVPPDEKLMRSLEQKVNVPEHGKDSFRNEIFRKVAMAHRRGEQFAYTTHEKLKEAIEKQLFEERRDTIKLTISARSPDTEQVRKLNDVVETLVAREGYCSECANELLKYVSSLLAREK